MKRFVKWLVWAACGTMGFALIALVALFFVVKAIVAPLPGEWTTELGAGPLRVKAGVPSLIRLGTAPWLAQWLHGVRVPVRAGVLHLQWAEPTQTLTVHCAPCQLQGGHHSGGGTGAAGAALSDTLSGVLGQEAVQIDDLQVSVRRRGIHLDGQVRAGKLVANWKGELQRQQLSLQLDLAPAPMADVYALFAKQIPEVGKAQIEGSFALKAQLSLPSGSLTVQPHMQGLRVSGLGTQALAHARTSCGASSRLSADSWLARAVLAAEDQRFFEHTGFDMVEINESLAKNQRSAQIERGGSTLSQQLAKLLITGAQRSPTRKLRELLYAVEMEETLGKARILRLYLDNAPWGAGICGAEAAAQHYFGSSARKLQPEQAVWLAAMLHNPGLEAQRWEQSGAINIQRAQWVAKGVRHVPKAQRLALAESLRAMPLARAR
jgi:monofunctional glycosyltransferase